jgi:hypothetical protein
MANQPRTAAEQALANFTFNDGGAVAGRSGRRPGSIQWQRKKAGPKPNDRKRPTKRKARAPRPFDPAQALRKADLAFQHAMQCAVAQGREHPPMIGVFKDARRLDAPRLFEPVPYSSGCTSPALVCAELEADIDPLAIRLDET